MQQNIKSLYEFVDAAEKDRKYPMNSAAGIRAALKMFEDEMNDDEKSSVKLFKERLDQISTSVFSGNKDKISASSFQVYVRRIKRVLKDYEAYGSDPKLMASWSPAKKVVSPKKLKADDSGSIKTPDANKNENENQGDRDRYEINTGSGKITFFVPSNISENEVGLLDSFVVFLKAKAKLLQVSKQ